MKRVGIYGGTFNPVHIGHVAAAKAFTEEAKLDALYIVPNFISPFKSQSAASADERTEMLRLAFKGFENTFVSDFETSAGGTSYAWKTIRHFKETFPSSELLYLIGDDNFERFCDWVNVPYIIQNCRLCVANRLGDGFEERVREFEKKLCIKVIPLKSKMITVSSTDLRAGSRKELLPDGVFEYIKERGLYK